MTQSLGQRIYQYRRGNGLSQEDLAESLNVSRQSVSKWETDGSIPDLDKLVALSELFGITLDELVKGENSGQSVPAQEPASEPAAETSVVEDTVETQHIQNIPLSERFWCTRRIVGFSLLGATLLFAFFLFCCNVTIPVILITSSPLWLCGAVCLTFRRHIGIGCCWGVLMGIVSFISSQSSLTIYNFNLITSVYAFLHFDDGPYSLNGTANPIVLAVHVICSCLTIALMVLTVAQFSKDPISVNRRFVVRSCIAWGIFSVLYISFQCLFMEINTLYYEAIVTSDQDVYLFLSRILNTFSPLLSFMRPIALTVLLSVIASFVREKKQGLKR